MVLGTLALTLGAAACGGSGGSGETAPPPPPPAPTATAPQAPPPPPAPALTTVRIDIHGGKVKGGPKRTTVKKGERVTIVVGSDVADSVHLHGYDEFGDVAPGKPARLTFVASLPGRFEVELEGRGLQIADIEVRP